MPREDLDSMLRLLAFEGLSAVPVSEFVDLGGRCERRCGETGDGRYCVLAQLFMATHNWWDEHDERGGVPVKLAEEIDELLQRELGAVLTASEAASATSRAQLLAREVAARYLPPSDWLKRGYVVPFENGASR